MLGCCISLLGRVFLFMREYLKKFWTGKQLRWRLPRMLLVLVILFYGTFMLMENFFIYSPAKYPAGDWDTTPVRAGNGLVAKIEDVEFAAPDGAKLHGWLFTPQRQDESGELREVETDWAVLWCPGNAGNITYRKDKAACLVQLPAAVFIFDYPGYGKSKGSPGETELYAAAEGAWQVLAQRGFKPERMIIHGVSLGSGPAVELATKVQPAAVVLEGAFTSLPEMAAVAYPFVPRFLVRTQFNNRKKIAKLTCPKLIIHGNCDRVIPFRLGKQLYQAASEPKTFYEVDGAGHDDVYLQGRAYLDKWRELISRIEQMP